MKINLFINNHLKDEGGTGMRWRIEILIRILNILKWVTVWLVIMSVIVLAIAGLIKYASERVLAICGIFLAGPTLIFLYYLGACITDRIKEDTDRIKEEYVKGILKMTKQKKLERIAKRAKNWRFRAAAVGKLTDPSLLAEIAQKDSSSSVRVLAVGKLTDPSLLAEIAQKDSSSNVRAAAVGKLTDPSLLAEIAQKDSSSDVRAAAVGKLTDPSLLAEIAQKDNSSYVRILAVGKLTDPSLLAEIAQKNSCSNVRAAAVEKLTDPSLLAEIAQKDSSSDVRILAVGKLIEFDLEDELLSVLIRVLGHELRYSESESIKNNAAYMLLRFYKRYGNSKHGEEIRKYEGVYEGGHFFDESYSYESGNSYRIGEAIDTRFRVTFSIR